MCKEEFNSECSLPAGDIIGGVIGGVVGGGLLFTAVSVTVGICLCYWYRRSKLHRRQPLSTTIATYPDDQPATYRAQATPYQPYMPPPPAEISTAANLPGSGFVSPPPAPQPSAPLQPRDAQLYNAEAPPPYPGTGYAGPPHVPAPEKATDYPGQDT